MGNQLTNCTLPADLRLDVIRGGALLVFDEMLVSCLLIVIDPSVRWSMNTSSCALLIGTVEF
jgi:hypothetical protein